MPVLEPEACSSTLHLWPLMKGHKIPINDLNTSTNRLEVSIQDLCTDRLNDIQMLPRSLSCHVVALHQEFMRPVIDRAQRSASPKEFCRIYTIKSGMDQISFVDMPLGGDSPLN